MSVDLLGQVKQIFNDEIVRELASSLEEQPDHVERTLAMGGPSILASLLHATTRPHDGPALVEALRREPPEMARLDSLATSPNMLRNLLEGESLETLVGHGRSMLHSLLGDKLGRLVNLIADDSGVKAASASTIISLLAPVFTGLIRRAPGGREVSLEGLHRLLADQREGVLRHAPAGLAGVLGLPDLAELDAAPRTVEPSTIPSSRPAVALGRDIDRSFPTEPAPSAGRWAVPAALAALALLAGFYLIPRAGERNAPVLPPEPLGPVAHDARPEPSSPAVTESGAPVVETTARGVALVLPGDVTIEVPENSYIAAMVKTLRDGKPVESQTFVASDLTFDQDGKLTAEGTRSIDSIAKIAAAYPKMKLKVNGRESLKDASPAVTREDAMKHAETVRDALVHAGVPADRITTEAVAANLPAEHPAAVAGDDVPISLSLIAE